MKRLKIFNQILFSIAGITFLFILILAGIRLYHEFEENDYKASYQPLIVKDELDSLSELNLRNQVISHSDIYLFDSASKTYLIPIQHRLLKEAMRKDRKVFQELISSSGDFNPYGWGDYNNMVLYSFHDHSVEILLKERLNIDEYQTYDTKNGKILILRGWDEDTNKDGQLGSDDLQKVYLYQHNKNQIRLIENDRFRIIESKYLTVADQLLFLVSDIQSDSITQYGRPSFFVTYSYDENRLIPLLENETQNTLQSIIDY